LRDYEALLHSYDKSSATPVVFGRGGVLVWALKLGMLKNQPILTLYTEKLMTRPAFQQADEDFYAQVDS
jgi:hypothetical protein